jgi:hypothetical protein
MVAKLFQQSSSEQKTGMLQQLLASAGPAAFAQVLASKGSSSSNLVGKSGEVTPEMAAQVTPETVEAIAT